MTPARYRIVLSGQEIDLPEEWVIPWVTGFACARGFLDQLEALDRDAPQETQRIHILQIGHAAGWFTYLYILREGGTPL